MIVCVSKQADVCRVMINSSHNEFKRLSQSSGNFLRTVNGCRTIFELHIYASLVITYGHQ